MFKFVIGGIIIILICSYWGAFLDMIGRINWKKPSIYWFGAGFILFLPLWILLVKKGTFFLTLEHEIAHIIMGILFFQKPVALAVYETGAGVVWFAGGNFLIALAPYFLPTLVLFLFAVYPTIRKNNKLHFHVALGFFTSYHFLSTVGEFSYRQTDILYTGPVFSTVFVIFLNLLVYGMIISFVTEGGRGVKYFLLRGVENMKSLFVPYWEENEKPKNFQEWIEEFF